jgi:hypothetical protein
MRTNICADCTNEFDLKSNETKISAKYCPDCKAERTDTVVVLVDDGKWKPVPNGTERLEEWPRSKWLTSIRRWKRS